MTAFSKLTCHCGAVELEVLGLEKLDNVYRCDCTYCARRGAIMTAVPKENVRIVQGEGVLSFYKWGTNTAKHYFCSKCGIYTHHRRAVNPKEFGLNVACFEDLNPRDLGDVPWPAVTHR